MNAPPSGARPRRRRRSAVVAAAQPATDGRSFAALDFETATPRRDSACAIGVVIFDDGAVAHRHMQLIRPPDNEYTATNRAIHGISPEDTENAESFPEVWQSAQRLLEGRMVVVHNSDFDMSVLRESFNHYNMEPQELEVVCTLGLARDMLPHVRSLRLDELAARLKIPFVHHDVVSDAETAGRLWLVLSQRHNATPEVLLRRFGRRYQLPVGVSQARRPQRRREAGFL